MVLLAGAVALVAALVWSVSVGAAGIDLGTVWRAVFAFDHSSSQHLVIQEFRLPRVVASAVVGASLAVAGALMQGLTRNPLASPTLMGLNGGASLLLVIGIAFLPGVGFTGLMLMSFVGAALGVGLVYGLGSSGRGGLTPVRLALAGTAVSALLGSLADGIVHATRIAQDVLFYLAGGVQGVRWPQLDLMLPWALGALALAILLAPGVALLNLGEDVARGLGQRTGRLRFLASVCTLVLAGGAVALAGGVGFVGLVVPHMMRFLVGVDYRWIIPGSAVFGALLLVLADLGARMVNPPYELPVGLITALIGVPFFIYLARRGDQGL